MTLHLRTAALVFLIATVLFSIAPIARQKHDGVCSYRTVAGTFGYAATGIRTGVGPVASAGSITFGDDGSVEGKQTASFNGTFATETYEGTYVVDDDCHGAFKVDVTSSNPIFNRTTTVDLVWENDGNATHAIFTSPGTVITADARRLFLRD